MERKFSQREVDRLNKKAAEHRATIARLEEEVQQHGRASAQGALRQSWLRAARKGLANTETRLAEELKLKKT